MSFSSLLSYFRKVPTDPTRRQTHAKRVRASLCLEQFEDRFVPSTFSVVNLLDSGAGSLRQAILDGNSNPGADTIQFNVAGTIKLTSAALPAITGRIDIDGSTAPGYAGTPQIAVDYNHFDGLRFSSGAAGSALRSLALDNAAGAGVSVNGGGYMLIVGNYIGLALDGTTVAGNGGNGLEFIGSYGNTVGGISATERNIISGNLNNGISFSASSNNRIVNNFIGADVTGTLDLGNTGNGVLVTAGSAQNLIGGTDTGGNDPTNHIFIRPPQGNLISGNNGNGILLTGNATRNQISGNFIGTAFSGNSPLGNSLDGVAIVNANNNALIGCTFQQNPFVFYNVISGNGGNGLRVTNSNDTTIQANFFGLGADNHTAVGNYLNGVLVEGNSTRTLMGGPIPLGNVDAANRLNGIVVKDTASYFTSYNTFCGLAAFNDDPTLGNGQDGMLITSTGGNILIRTNVIARNGDDGIEISGNARDVRVAGNIIGLNTEGQVAMGNVDNGVEVAGNAHDLFIGGPQPAFNVILRNIISANGGNGVALLGNVHNITVSHSYIGTNYLGLQALGNANAGVLIGAGTFSNTIGSTDPRLVTLISGNRGNGIEMQSTHHNLVIGTVIGADVSKTLPLPNLGHGVFLANSNDNTIGRPYPYSFYFGLYPANLIAFNGGSGVFVASGNNNAIQANSIFANTLLGIDLGPTANQQQAAPVFTVSRPFPFVLKVTGSLTSTPNTLFAIEIFANTTSGPSGRYSLGFQYVRTNAAGVANFTIYRFVPLNVGSFFTATATNPMRNTSEFSKGA